MKRKLFGMMGAALLALMVLAGCDNGIINIMRVVGGGGIAKPAVINGWYGLLLAVKLSRW